MSRLPIVSFRQMERVLLRLGVESVRQKGSHVVYRHSDGRTTTAPNHPGRDLARPLLRDIELSPEQFQEELRRV